MTSENSESFDLPENEVSLLKHILSQLGPGKSLSKIYLPAWFSEKRSLLERFTDWMLHADVLRLMNHEEQPEFRMMHLCTWIVSGLHFTPKLPKKPYSSLRGECFRAALYSPDGQKCIGSYIGEQVQQNPSICAYHYKDREGNIAIWGNAEMKSKLHINSVGVIMNNPNTITNVELLSRGETYTYNFPDLYGRGIFSGKKITEICGHVTVKCEKTGVCAEMKFHKKSHKRGYNMLHGTIYYANNKKSKNNALISFEGNWRGKITYTIGSSKDQNEMFDATTAQKLKVVIPPIEEQSPYESQYIWRKVTEYLVNNDPKNANEHQMAIAEKQKKISEICDKNKIKWNYQLFDYDNTTKRYVPKDLDLSPYEYGEEPVIMHAGFVVPAQIQNLEDLGIVLSNDELQRSMEAKLHGSA